MVTSGAAMNVEQIRGAVERAGFVLTVDDRQAGPHDHSPVHLLAAQATQLDDYEFSLGGVGR